MYLVETWTKTLCNRTNQFSHIFHPFILSPKIICKICQNEAASAVIYPTTELAQRKPLTIKPNLTNLTLLHRELEIHRWQKNDFVEYKHHCHEKLDTSKTKNSIILASLRSFKREEYDTFQWLWYDYCERNNLDPIKPITIENLEIFNFLFDEDLPCICQ